MKILTEGRLRLLFPSDWLVTHYDKWTFVAQFTNVAGGSKAVDVVALSPNDHELWLLEVKDYRIDRRLKDISVWDEFALKVRDTLAGLLAAAFNAEGEEKTMACRCVRASRLSVVLHLEQAQHRSKLFAHFPERADLVTKLRPLLKSIDAHPRVVSLASPLSSAPWQTESIGGGNP